MGPVGYILENQDPGLLGGSGPAAEYADRRVGRFRQGKLRGSELHAAKETRPRPGVNITLEVSFGGGFRKPPSRAATSAALPPRAIRSS